MSVWLFIAATAVFVTSIALMMWLAKSGTLARRSCDRCGIGCEPFQALDGDAMAVKFRCPKCGLIS